MRSILFILCFFIGVSSDISPAKAAITPQDEFYEKFKNHCTQESLSREQCLIYLTEKQKEKYLALKKITEDELTDDADKATAEKILEKISDMRPIMRENALLKLETILTDREHRSEKFANLRDKWKEKRQERERERERQFAQGTGETSGGTNSATPKSAGDFTSKGGGGSNSGSNRERSGKGSNSSNDIQNSSTDIDDDAKLEDLEDVDPVDPFEETPIDPKFEQELAKDKELQKIKNEAEALNDQIEKQRKEVEAAIKAQNSSNQSSSGSGAGGGGDGNKIMDMLKGMLKNLDIASIGMQTAMGALNSAKNCPQVAAGKKKGGKCVPNDAVADCVCEIKNIANTSMGEAKSAQEAAEQAGIKLASSSGTQNCFAVNWTGECLSRKQRNLYRGGENPNELGRHEITEGYLKGDFY